MYLVSQYPYYLKMKKISLLYRFGNPDTYKKTGGNCLFHMNKCEKVKYQIPDSAKVKEFYILVFKENPSEIPNLPQ